MSSQFHGNNSYKEYPTKPTLYNIIRKVCWEYNGTWNIYTYLTPLNMYITSSCH